MKNGIQVAEAQLITPAWASEVLTRHYKRIEEGLFVQQRPITPAHVMRLAADMSNDDWVYTPEGIIFDVNGDLIDGQHRLEGVRKSGKSIKMRVETGWPAETIQSINVGRPRTVTDLLHMRGYQYAKNYASAVRFMGRVAHCNSSFAFSQPSVVHFLENEGCRSNIDKIVSKTKTHRDFQARMIGPLAYYHTARPNKAMAFAEGLFNLEFDNKSAIQAFLNWEKARAAIDTQLRIKAFCSALRSWDAGLPVDFIRPTVEAVEWLSNLNPRLRKEFRERCPQLSKVRG